MRGGEVVGDPAAAVGKFVEVDGDDVAVSVDVVNPFSRADGDNLPGLDRVIARVTNARAGVDGTKPNGAVMFAAGIKADEAHGKSFRRR